MLTGVSLYISTVAYTIVKVHYRDISNIIIDSYIVVIVQSYLPP